MEKIFIGYIQGVHGLRGDLKIKNKFECPEKIFKKGNIILLNEEEHEITACKFYKGFYLVTIDNIKNINLVEKYIGYDVFIKRKNLNLKEGEFLYQDLKGMNIIESNSYYGKVINIDDNGIYKILEVRGENKFMIPFVKEYIKKVSIKDNTIYCENIKGLIL